MKKIEYFAPEMETIKLNYCKLICDSGEEPVYEGEGGPSFPAD